MKINVKWILFLPLLFFFLPAFVFWVPFLKTGYLYFFLILFSILIFLFIKDTKVLISRFYNIVKNTPLKYFIFVMILIVLNSIFLTIIGVTSFSQTCRSIIMQFCLFIIPILLYFTYITTKYISFKSFIKTFILFFYIMLLFGFIAYFGQLFDISIINNFFDFFANMRLLKFKAFNLSGTVSNYTAFGLPRLDNFYEEPSYYAKFLYLYLPLTYSFSSRYFSYTRSKFLNIIIQKTIIPLTWIQIILTLSPIFLLFSILITVIYFYKPIFYFIKKYSLFVIGLIFFILILLNKVDFSDTYLSRIVNVLFSIKSFEDFAIIEPSLANRIINYVNSLCICLKHPLTGVGIGNMATHMLVQYQHSPIPLTSFLEDRANFAIITGNRLPLDYGFIYSFLAENGIIITFLFINFNIKLMNKIIRLQKFAYKDSFDFIITMTFEKMLIATFILYFYDFTLVTQEWIFLYALIFAYIYNTQKGKANE